MTEVWSAFSISKCGVHCSGIHACVCIYIYVHQGIRDCLDGSAWKTDKSNQLKKLKPCFTGLMFIKGTHEQWFFFNDYQSLDTQKISL